MIRTVPLLLSLWVCILSAVYKPILQSFEEGGLAGVVSDGLGANYIVWFALICATILMKDVPLKGAATRVLCVVGLLLYPSATVAWLAASLVAGYMVYLSAGHIAAVLLFATTIREPLTTLCLKIFAGNILGFDAILTNWALWTMGQNAILQSNIVLTQSNQPLLILTGCSVFANLSYVTLLWLSLHVYTQRPIDRISWGILIAAVLLTLASNAFRLALMTGSTHSYVFYHDGMGAQAFEWGLMIGVIFLVLGGLKLGRTKT